MALAAQALSPILSQREREFETQLAVFDVKVACIEWRVGFDGQLEMSAKVSNLEKKKKPAQVDLDRLARGVRLILEGIGEDPDREGLRETPRRVAEMYAELTAGMREDPSAHVVPLSGNKHDEMVIVKDISIASLCEHHLAPFVGKCHIAYIPKDGRILGVSKLARLAETFARRLQLQERLTSEIANTLFDRLQPLGVMVVIEAEHTCMTLRGVK